MTILQRCSRWDIKNKGQGSILGLLKIPDSYQVLFTQLSKYCENNTRNTF